MKDTPQDIIDLVNSGRELSDKIRQFVDKKREQCNRIDYDLKVEWSDDYIPILTATKRTQPQKMRTRIREYLSTLSSICDRLNATMSINKFLQELMEAGFDIEYSRDLQGSHAWAISGDNSTLISNFKDAGLCDTISIVKFEAYNTVDGQIVTMAHCVLKSDYPELTAMVNEATDSLPNRAEIHDEYKKFLDLLDNQHIQVKYTKDQVKMHGGRTDIPNEFILSTNLEDDNYMTNLVDHLIATNTESIQIVGVRVVLPEKYPTTCIMFITFYNNRVKKATVDNTDDQKKKWFQTIKQKLDQMQPILTNESRGSANWLRMPPQSSNFIDTLADATGKTPEELLSKYLGHPTQVIRVDQPSSKNPYSHGVWK